MGRPGQKPRPFSPRTLSSRRAEAIVGRPVNRAAIVDSDIRRLVAELEVDFLAIVELCREVIDGAYHERFNFPTAEAYLEDRTGWSYGTIRKRLRTLDGLRALPAQNQDAARKALASIGATKAAIVAPAIQKDPDGFDNWIEHAKLEPAPKLQERVSRALGHRARGPAAATEPGAGWYRRLLALPGWPDELRADTERAFKLAEVALQKPGAHPLECWAAIVHEFIGTYEPKGATA